jgi:Mn2+/Fe2+ NRAMP family transporter
VGVGAFFSNMVMFFIILTTAITLNRHGITNIETSRQAAEALRPFAGNFAATLFTWALSASGFLPSPRWPDLPHTPSLRRWDGARAEQETETGALVLRSDSGLYRVGVALDFIGINPVKALYWTAVINGLLAPFLLVAILIVAADKKLMQGQPSSRLGWIVVAITTIAMFARALRCLFTSPQRI